MKLLFTLLLGCACVLNAIAQENLALSIDQAVQIASERSKMLHASQMKVEAAEGKTSEVQASRLPSIKLTGGYTRQSAITPFVITLPGSGPSAGQQFTVSPSIVNNYVFRATLAQPLFTGFRLQSSQEMADLTAQATEQDFGRDRSDIVYNTRSAYWNLLRAMEVKKSVDETVEQVRAHVADAQNLLEQGLATNNDVLKIQVQLSNAELLQIEAKNAVQIGMVALNNIMSLPLNTIIQPVSPLKSEARDSLDLHALTEKALQNRPDLKGMEYRLKASEAGVTMAQSGWYPQIALIANYVNAKPNSRIVPATELFRDTWDVGINFSFDLWNWLSTAHQTTQAKAQMRQTQDMYGTLKDGVALEVTQSYLGLVEAREKIVVAAKTVTQAEENYRITNEKYKEGLVLTLDLLDADVDLLRAKTNYTQSLVDYELSLARLVKSIGTTP
jgi:outer membrane protein